MIARKLSEEEMNSRVERGLNLHSGKRIAVDKYHPESITSLLWEFGSQPREDSVKDEIERIHNFLEMKGYCTSYSRLISILDANRACSK